MALLTTGDWYQISINNTNDAAWGALGTPPEIPQPLIDYIVNGTTFTIYVLDAATGFFSYSGGLVTGYDDSLLIASAILTKITYTDTDANGTEWAKDGAGAVFQYDNISGRVREFSGAETAAFKAFLP